jgi:hypothetical protein
MNKALKSQLNNFQNTYKYFVYGFLIMLFLTFGFYFFTDMILTIELVLGITFTAFLAVVTYLGSYILILKKEIEELKNQRKK